MVYPHLFASSEAATGWTEYADDDGSSFYHNRSTGVSTYDPPPHVVAAAIHGTQHEVPLLGDQEYLSTIRTALQEVNARSAKYTM